MPLCLYRERTAAEPRLGLIVDERVVDVAAAGGPASWAEALRLSRADLEQTVAAVRASGTPSHRLADVQLAAPIDRQEVWAAGVTYLRSRDARMEESTQKSVYDVVYDADRPEIFLKATPNRVSGPGAAVAVRGDSTWDVPEPELALVVNAAGEVVGYTVGNDVSSRSIEGENPLYLPQAKVYRQCAGLGPVVALASEVRDVNALTITLTIRRDGQVFFRGETSTAQIHRTFADLVGYLFRCNEFPDGAVLMTGTGIIPPNEFTLRDGDVVDIAISEIGTLSNPVVKLEV